MSDPIGGIGGPDEIYCGGVFAGHTDGKKRPQTNTRMD
jgi:hypothetical protein